MSRRRKSKTNRGNPFVVALLTLAILVGLYHLNHRHQPGAPRQSSDRFETLENCHLIDHRNNDGDSFHVEHKGKTYEFRLYYVDCPEKRRHQYNGDRLAEQGLALGNLSERETIKVGEAAKKFTENMLEERAFTVTTKWESVFRSGRYYAFVSTPALGSDHRFLHESLVTRGLARIHTKGVNLPDGTPWKRQRAHLKELEKIARSKQLGAWK